MNVCDNGEIKKAIDIGEKYNCGIEIQAFSIPENNTEENISIHKDLLKNISSIALHGPFRDLCPGSPDPMIREVTRERLEQGFACALRLNASHVIYHHGYVPNTSYYSGWLKRSIAFWQDFLENKPIEINFHIENLLEHDANLISDLLEGISRQNIDICLDIGHAHSLSKISIINWIEHLKKKIGYVHLHDNHREKDEHIGLGKGNIPLVEVLTLLKEYSPNALWALEANMNDMDDSILWLKENGFM